MSERLIILRKELHELESELSDVFRLPLDPESGRRHQIFADDVRKRFSFLKNLYSSEVASRPRNAEQLQEIGEKLRGLEAGFLGWNKYRTSALRNGYYLDDTLAVCSDCNQRFPNDDLGINASRRSDHAELVDEKLEKEESGRIWGKFGKFCGAFGSGIVIGAICMIVVYFSSDLHHYEAFLHPPT